MFMCFDPEISFWATKFRNNVGKDLCIKDFSTVLLMTVKN